MEIVQLNGHAPEQRLALEHVDAHVSQVLAARLLRQTGKQNGMGWQVSWRCSGDAGQRAVARVLTAQLLQGRRGLLQTRQAPILITRHSTPPGCKTGWTIMCMCTHGRVGMIHCKQRSKSPPTLNRTESWQDARRQMHGGTTTATMARHQQPPWHTTNNNHGTAPSPWPLTCLLSGVTAQGGQVVCRRLLNKLEHLACAEN